MKTASILILCLLFAGCNFMGLTHGANERVVFLDGSEQLVTIDLVRLRTEYNYKVVTTNQNLADATAVPFTWKGGTVRPLSPVNVRGSRNAAGDLLIQWTRRTRIGVGLRPYSDVPLGEEKEVYDVEVYDGSTLKRTWRVEVGAVQPATLTGFVFDLYGTQGMNAISGNGLLAPPTDGSSSSRAYSQQIIDNTAFVEATLVTTGGGASGHNAFLGVNSQEDAQVLPSVGAGWYSVQFYQNGSGQTFLVARDNVTAIYTSGALPGSPTSVKIRIAFSDENVTFYRDYSGPGSVPLGVAMSTPTFPYLVTLIANQTARIDNVLIRNSQNSGTTYSANLQYEDFGALQSSVKVRVYQVSKAVGRGAYYEANL